MRPCAPACPCPACRPLPRTLWEFRRATRAAWREPIRFTIEGRTLVVTTDDRMTVLLDVDLDGDVFTHPASPFYAR